MKHNSPVDNNTLFSVGYLPLNIFYIVCRSLDGTSLEVCLSTARRCFEVSFTPLVFNIYGDFFNLNLSKMSKNKQSAKNCPESKFNHAAEEVHTLVLKLVALITFYVGQGLTSKL